MIATAQNMKAAYEVTKHASRKDWLAGRHKTIGASEVAAVLGRSRFLAPFGLWHRKVCDPQPEDLTIEQEVGLALEPYLS